MHSIFLQVKKLLNVIFLSCNHYTLCVKDEHFKINVISMITTSLHNSLHTQSELSFSLNLRLIIKIFNSQELLTSISVA